VTVRNFAGLMLCAAIFLALAHLDVWFAVSFVLFVIGAILLAFCYGLVVIRRAGRGWYKRP